MSEERQDVEALAKEFSEEAETALEWLYEDDLGHEFEEPYLGAGYCGCDHCQKFAPPIHTAKALVAALREQVERLRGERDRLRARVEALEGFGPAVVDAARARTETEGVE